MKNYNMHGLEAMYIRQKHPRDVQVVMLSQINFFQIFLGFGEKFLVKTGHSIHVFDYSIIPSHQET